MRIERGRWCRGSLGYPRARGWRGSPTVANYPLTHLLVCHSEPQAKNPGILHCTDSVQNDKIGAAGVRGSRKAQALGDAEYRAVEEKEQL